MNPSRVLTIAVETMEDGADYLPRFGRKYFLRPLFDEVAMYTDATWADFATAMLNSHFRDGPIRLSRADLVPAMDSELVQDSCIAYENATFHFAEFRHGP